MAFSVTAIASLARSLNHTRHAQYFWSRLPCCVITGVALPSSSSVRRNLSRAWGSKSIGSSSDDFITLAELSLTTCASLARPHPSSDHVAGSQTVRCLADCLWRLTRSLSASRDSLLTTQISTLTELRKWPVCPHSFLHPTRARTGL